ncbi:hypothetical protein BH24ACT5_BH24ACT5_25410 [soil metagenome]
MRVRAVPSIAMVAGMLVVGAVACDDPSSEHGTRESRVLMSVIREVATTATTDPESTPVVYVVSVAENGVAATVQAEVAAELKDDIDLRFADERAEAVEEDVDGQPVPNDGVLLLVGDIPVDGSVIDVPIEIYHSETDRSKASFTFTEADDDWSVTATSLLAPPTG